jgi:hypothetical protein
LIIYFHKIKNHEEGISLSDVKILMWIYQVIIVFLNLE